MRALQSGSPNGPLTLHEAGIVGTGEIIAVLDTGLDWDSCYFAEPDGSPPPINTIDPNRALEASNVDPFRRKVIAYDLLYSCDEYPTAGGCDAFGMTDAADNQGHGTHAAGAIAADRGVPVQHEFGDAIAPGARLVIQDAGYVGGDDCSQRPGLRCPVRDLRDVLEQAWAQGARIHSNSWGDRQGNGPGEIPPTGNYNDSTAEIDQFVFEHPEMVVVFNSGNAGQLGPSSISSPGSAKNTIQVGGFSWFGEVGAVVEWSGSGPTWDGRLKPELVAPAFVLAADSDLDVSTENCDHSLQGGTSWSGPLVAGAAALVRQFYRRGGLGDAVASASGFNPSSALVKATLVASARPLAHFQGDGPAPEPIPPVPSWDQGFGMPVLDDVLPFEGDPESLWVRDTGRLVVRNGEKVRFRFDVSDEERFRVVLAWIDPPGEGSGQPASVPRLVNDLDLRVIGPDGHSRLGNQSLGVAPDRVNNIEVVTIDPPAPGRYTVVIEGHEIREGLEQSAALVVSGSFAPAVERRHSVRRR